MGRIIASDLSESTKEKTGRAKRADEKEKGKTSGARGWKGLLFSVDGERCSCQIMPGLKMYKTRNITGDADA